MPIPPIIGSTPFDTPMAPDLGCFVERKHGFQFGGDFALWSEFSPWTSSGIIPHQAYFRVKCGKAAWFQRVKAWMRPQLDGFIVNGINPDHVLGGEFRPYPSDWIKYPPQRINQSYWFRGEHRNPNGGAWTANAAVGHSFDIYDNGTLSTTSWDDTGGDRDFDDMTIEVAIVFRTRWFDPVLEQVDTLDEAGVARFINEEFPKFRAKDRPQVADAPA